MKLTLACLAWIVIGAILGTSIWLFGVKGNPWPLAASAALFIIAIGKIGCATH